MSSSGSSDCWPCPDSGPHSSRIIHRDGKVQICIDRLSLGQRQRYWKSTMTTLLDLNWRWILVIFSLSFIVTWFIFAIVYYAIAKHHGDFDVDAQYDNFVPCFNDVQSFTSAFLFSLETQHTIGYGSRNPSAECSEAAYAVFLQFIVGVAVQCVTAGLVVAKLQTGKRTSKALLFSERACVGKCEGEVCFMVRIGNAGRSELVNATGYGVLVERTKSKSGEEILSESILEFTSENGSGNLNFLWPAVIHCPILEKTDAFLKKIQSDNTELIVTVEGTLESTGQTLQLRSSYLAHEIEIGRLFVDISPQLTIDKGTKNFHYELDYSDFNVSRVDEEWNYNAYKLKR